MINICFCSLIPKYKSQRGIKFEIKNHRHQPKFLATPLLVLTVKSISKEKCFSKFLDTRSNFSKIWCCLHDNPIRVSRHSLVGSMLAYWMYVTPQFKLLVFNIEHTTLLSGLRLSFSNIIFSNLSNIMISKKKYFFGDFLSADFWQKVWE